MDHITLQESYGFLVAFFIIGYISVYSAYLSSPSLTRLICIALDSLLGITLEQIFTIPRIQHDQTVV